MSGSLVSLSELAHPRRHLFLSPHYDDIALSCGGTASLIANGGRTPEVALIFGDHPDPALPMTAFANKLHQQWGLSADEVIAGRRSEEAAASAVLGTTARFLPFRDAIYRGERYLNDEQLFARPAADEAGVPAQIADAAANGDVTGARVYVPLGVGFHVDHQLAFLAGLDLASRGAEVWCYEDLPYGLIAGRVDARLAEVSAHVHAPVLVDVGDSWDAKIDAILAYPSQLSTIFEQYVGIGTSREAISEGMAAYARSVGEGRLCERFWRVR